MAKSESEGGQDSQIMSENSKFLEENVEGFQQCVNETLNLTKLATDLSRMHEALADKNVNLIKEVSKNTDTSTTPIKTQHVGSSTSASVGYECTLDTSEGGFQISTKEASESSMSIKNDASKVHDPEVLLEKISTLEKEVTSLKKEMQNLTDENALLESEMAKLKYMASVEVYKKQVATAEEENRKLKNDLSRQLVYQAHLVCKTESNEKTIVLLDEKLHVQQAGLRKLQEQVNSSLADISKRDEEIKKLNDQIKLLKSTHSVQGNKWNTDMEMLKREFKEKCELVDDLNQKYDALMKVVDRQREVASDDAV